MILYAALGAVLALAASAVGIYGIYSRGVLANHHIGLTSFPHQLPLDASGSLYSNEYSRGILKQIGGTEKRQIRVLFLTAHPDDETMFFGPTLLSLAHQHGNDGIPFEMYLHCLSKGVNCGEVRAEEVKKAAPILGIPIERVLVDDMQDGQDWSAEEVADRLEESVRRWKIDVVVTFDGFGVSGHKNHKSCFHGASIYQDRQRSDGSDEIIHGEESEKEEEVKRRRRREEGRENGGSSTTSSSYHASSSSSSSPSSSSSGTHNISSNNHILTSRNPPIFVLQSFSIFSKYLAWFSFPSSVRALRQHPSFLSPSSPLLFANPHPRSIHLAMLAHHSQYVWFRKLFVASSLFVFYNFLLPL
jgi:hypothetical protein